MREKLVHVFKDKDGILLMADVGEPDVEQTARVFNFSEGWTVEKITRDEYQRLYPPRFNDPSFGISDLGTPSKQIKRLKLHHDALIEILEDSLKLKKGDLKRMIEERLEKR